MKDREKKRPSKPTSGAKGATPPRFQASQLAGFQTSQLTGAPHQRKIFIAGNIAIK